MECDDLKFVFGLCPTRDRPLFLPFAIWQWEQQTYGFRRLFVSGSWQGERPVRTVATDCGLVRCSAGREGVGSLVENVRAGVRAIMRWASQRSINGASAYVAFFEDDDWYDPRRIEYQMDEIGDAPAHGYPFTQYVDLRTGRGRYFDHPGRSSLNGTLIRLDVLNAIGFPDTPHPDVTLWKELDGRGVLSGIVDEPHVVGIKHAIGKTAGNGHRGMCDKDGGWVWFWNHLWQGNHRIAAAFYEKVRDQLSASSLRAGTTVRSSTPSGRLSGRRRG